MGNAAYWMTEEELRLYELDMERSYEDNSYELDAINAELQILASEGV
jgi:hypothetical protein